MRDIAKLVKPHSNVWVVMAVRKDLAKEIDYMSGKHFLCDTAWLVGLGLSKQAAETIRDVNMELSSGYRYWVYESTIWDLKN